MSDQATSSPAWLTALATWAPIIIGGAIAALPKLLRLVTGGGDVFTQFFQARRRVAEAQRAAAKDDRDWELAKLREQVEALSRMVDQHQAAIEELRAEKSEYQAYSWEAYGEIRRLDPATQFRPPGHRPA